MINIFFKTQEIDLKNTVIDKLPYNELTDLFRKIFRVEETNILLPLTRKNIEYIKPGENRCVSLFFYPKIVRGDTFSRKYFTFKQDRIVRFLEHAQERDVYVRIISTIDEFNEEVAKHRNIRYLELGCHGNSQSLTLDPELPNGRIRKENIRLLKIPDFTPNATFLVSACKAGFSKDSIAAKLSDHFKGVYVVAPQEIISGESIQKSPGKGYGDSNRGWPDQEKKRSAFKKLKADVTRRFINGKLTSSSDSVKQ